MEIQCSTCKIRPASSNYKTCAICRERARKQRKQRLADGKCQSCGRPRGSDGTKQRCHSCFERDSHASKIRHQKIRHKVLQYYGGKCACCAEDREEFLALDHINGGGRAERRSLPNGDFYEYVLKNWPTHIRVLCHNCNMALGFYGYCPHQFSCAIHNTL